METEKGQEKASTKEGLPGLLERFRTQDEPELRKWSKDKTSKLPL